MSIINRILVSLNALILALFILTSPVLAQEAAQESAVPTAIVVQSLEVESGFLGFWMLIQITVFLLLVTLLLNGTVQKMLKVRVQRLRHVDERPHTNR